MKIRKRKSPSEKKRTKQKPQPQIFLRVSTWLLAIYIAALFFLKLYGLPVLPDEVKFLSSAKAMPSILAAYASYEYSYGGAFWVLVYAFQHLLGSTAVSAIFVALLISPLLIIWRHLDERERIIALIFWLTMPMAWWHGKIISADTLNVFILSLAILYAYRKNLFWMCFCVGFAIGVKLSAMFVMPAIFALYFWRAWPLQRKELENLVAAPLGFILACPSWLVSFQTNHDFLQSVTIKSPYPLISLESAMFGSSVTWDLAVSITPLGYIYTTIGYALLLGLAIWKRHVPLLCATLAFAGTCCLYLLSAVTTSWYCFPFFAFFFIALFLEQEKLRKSRLLLPVLALILFGQFMTYFMFNLQLSLIEAERNWQSKELAACLSDAVKDIGRPVYIRSFDSVEKRISTLTKNRILPGEYRWQKIEGDKDRLSQIRDVILVDAVFNRLRLYPGMVEAPIVCDRHFALMLPEDLRLKKAR